MIDFNLLPKVITDNNLVFKYVKKISKNFRISDIKKILENTITVEIKRTSRANNNCLLKFSDENLNYFIIHVINNEVLLESISYSYVTYNK